MTHSGKAGPLSGVRVVEFAGIGPAPMCGMLLSDLGADVVRIDRPSPADVGIKRPLETNFILRGRRTIKLDLKQPRHASFALDLIGYADCLIEGFRPGVMERLGLGPEAAMRRNPRLVYGRVTGWGQEGPLSLNAGHDINYIAITGALDAMGRKGERPPVPLNLVGDFAGGAMFLAIGLLAGVLDARASGKGQVVDAAIVDGLTAMMNSINGLRTGGVFSKERGSNILDSGAYFYDTYACADGKFVAVGAIEPKFYAEMLERLGVPLERMPPQNERSRWDEARAVLAEVFKTKTRDEWAGIFADSDACVSAVLSLEESFADPHMSERRAYVDVNGFTQGAPAPKFSRTEPANPSPPAEAVPLSALNDWMPASDLDEWQQKFDS
ncbi:MAG: CoA transferase [Hyphomicrobiaceae bacterium]|nr:CoA transferase [Hyphomicrobiaceae bacterium]